MKYWKFVFCYILLLVSIFVEGYTFFYLRTLQTTIYLQPSLFLASTLMTCFLSIWLLYHQEKFKAPKVKLDNYRIRSISLWITMALLLAYICYQFYDLFQTYEVAPDIVPAMQMYVGRLLGADPVYAPMVFESWTVYPNYLPLMWLPYLIPELLHFDYRWMAIILFLIALTIWAYRLIETSNAPVWMVGLHLFFPFLLLYYLIQFVPNDLVYNVEFTPIAFYYFLGLAVLYSGWIGLSATTLLCLLSRLAFSFWLPAFWIILWIERKFAYPFKIGLFCLFGILAIYIIPFVLKDPESFERGMNYYGTVSQEIWTQPWHARDGRPIVLQEGTSFAVYFYDQIAGEPLNRLAIAKRFHLIISLLAALIFFLSYWFLRKKINYKLLALIGLKFYLSIFYLFLHTPFAYLYLLPLFLSFPILWSLQLQFYKKEIA